MSDPIDLPIYHCKSRLLQRIRHSEVLIILGETGSGKTTQVPKYIYEAKVNDVGEALKIKMKSGKRKVLKKRMIAITQPRRVAAISIAKRVADEMNSAVGGLVGYSVRFENKTSDETVIKYMTDGMLLRESINDPDFKKYSFIIVDEAHERTVNSDLLLGLVKTAQEKRSKLIRKKHLKLIIMSATLDIERLANYFPSANVAVVEGREHSVKVYQAVDTQKDYVFSTISTILDLHQTLPIDHHVLAFLTGQDEIDTVVQYLKKLELPEDLPLKVFPLSASISYQAQLNAISPALKGVRKVVVSTNIAETSLTIPGIRVVIDCGHVKAKFHIDGVGLDVMKVIPTSKAQVWQRCGRAGREQDGIYYRLFTGDQYDAMMTFQEPELQRVNLAGVLLYLYKLGFEYPEAFEWIDPPSDMSLAAAKDELLKLEAIHMTEERTELTPLGSKMAEAPLSPSFSKILILASDSNFLVQEPVATVLAMLSSDSIFLTCDSVTQEKRKLFFSPYGDLILYLKIFRNFSKSRKKKEWCKNYKFSFRALKFVKKARKQLLEFCQSSNLTSRSAPQDDIYENIVKCFHRGLPQNVAHQVTRNTYRIQNSNYEAVTAAIHPSSSQHNRDNKDVTFTELVQISSGNNYIKHISFVERSWIQ